jgi:hypothetical protein
MAKKTVATLQTSSKRLSKAIKMVKSQNWCIHICRNNYAPELVDEFLNKK